MTQSEVWHAALSIIADYSPMAYWWMSNGAVFGWILTNRAQLLQDRFSEQPFEYTEIDSVCVFKEIRLGQEIVSCDWPALRNRLMEIPGLRVEELRDVIIPPASVPNQVLRLSVSE